MIEIRPGILQDSLAIAKDLTVPLVTANQQILAQFPTIAQSQEQFTGQL